MNTRSRTWDPLRPALLAGASAWTIVNYLAWLAWDQEQTYAPGSTYAEGPYEAWQVIGLALSLAAVAALAAWHRDDWGIGSAVAMTVTLTVTWSVDAAGDRTADADLWPIGAAALLGGSIGGLLLVVALTSGLRAVLDRARR